MKPRAFVCLTGKEENQHCFCRKTGAGKVYVHLWPFRSCSAACGPANDEEQGEQTFAFLTGSNVKAETDLDRVQRMANEGLCETGSSSGEEVHSNGGLLLVCFGGHCRDEECEWGRRWNLRKGERVVGRGAAWEGEECGRCWCCARCFRRSERDRRGLEAELEMGRGKGLESCRGARGGTSVRCVARVSSQGVKLTL